MSQDVPGRPRSTARRTALTVLQEVRPGFGFVPDPRAARRVQG
ncbi:hypothetical protein [Nonomuraea sp. NPDC049607]